MNICGHSERFAHICSLWHYSNAHTFGHGKDGPRDIHVQISKRFAHVCKQLLNMGQGHWIYFVHLPLEY